ncbi:VOC family protein [Pararhodobacter aggregans]|uniref:VOC family protein n=1 Tax=Pararhodobacter aggregans TaxID=404875 RepID=UPI003A937EE1
MIERLDRVALAVGDLEGATGFFERLLGIRFDPPLSDEAMGLDARYSPEGVELVAGKPGSFMEKLVQDRGEGVFCLVFKVRDMEAAVAHFRQMGLEPQNDVHFGALREVAFHPRDAHGLRIVLAAYPEAHPASVAVLGG